MKNELNCFGLVQFLEKGKLLCTLAQLKTLVIMFYCDFWRKEHVREKTSSLIINFTINILRSFILEYMLGN